MKALTITALLISLGTLAFAFVLSASLGNGVGISLDEADYDVTNVTSAQVSCGVATTTLLVAQSGRTSFEAYPVGTSTVYLCKSNSLCSATSGIPLYSTSSAYVQGDGYKGQYTCNAPLIVPVNIIYSF